MSMGSIENYEDGFNLRSSKPHERFEQYHKLILVIDATRFMG